MGRPRVLLVDHSVNVSGAEQSMLAGLAAPIHRSRFDFAVACPPGGKLEQEVRKLGVPVFRVPLGRLVRLRNPRTWLRHGLGFVRGMRELQDVVRLWRPAIVHANTTQAALAAGLAAGTAQARLVWHVRDLVELGLIGRWLYGRSDVVIAISQAVARTVFRGREGDAKLRVIVNGIDADEFCAQVGLKNLHQELNLPANAVTATVVGQLTPWKGHDVLLAAWPAVTREIPGAVLLIAGSALWEADRKWEEELKRLADKLRLGGSVRFLGRRDDVARIMAMSRCVVIPSRAEPFGRVALEAMALGKAVVGTAAGGLVEVVRDGATGRLAPPGDARALARAVVEVLGDESAARTMGEAGARRVREMFDIKETRRRIEKVYEEGLGRRGVRRVNG